MEKIAIVGLSCLFPGAETPQEYWQNLLAQKNVTATATAEQMGVDPAQFLAEGKGVQDKYYCIQGGYIQDFQFEPHGYRLPADFLSSLDSLFQWPLYVSKEALKDSGHFEDETALARCGLVFGNLSFPTKSSHHLFAPIYKQALETTARDLLKDNPLILKNLPADGPIAFENLMTFGYPTTVVSHALGLGGVNFALDAACASSLYAVKLASHYLLSGKADLMLAGAVSRADPFFINMGFSIFHAYPENGRSHPLDKSSSGLFAGEGAGVFVLKRYSDAKRDGDKIYAVISGIGLSNDGKGKFLLQPNPKGQILAFERAYANAGIDPKTIDYVECHATGTPVGDKTELNTMDSFFGQHQAKPLVGSVKSNLGHLLTAAGMAGMTKVILSMAHNQIPATINLTEPQSSRNDVISAEQIVKANIPWPAQGASKRAAVSAFGFGGANAHLILEEATQETQPNSASPPFENVKMAIVGMDAFFGNCNGLNSFGRTLYEGRQHFIPVPSGRWQGIEDQPELLQKYNFRQGKAPNGAYITDFEMDFLHFKIPPNNDQPIAQQLLILNVAERAIQDAGLKAGSNVAVIIAAGTELSLHSFRGRVDLSWQIKESLAQSGLKLSPEQSERLEAIAKESIHEPAQVNQYTSFIGNIMASRISAQWDFSGPTFTLSAEENSTFKALEVAQMFLAAGEVEAVIVGAVDLAGGVENVLIRNQQSEVNRGPNTLSIDQNATGWMVGEGAGAVALKRLEEAHNADDRVYAIVDAVSIVQSQQDSAPSAEGVQRACQQAFAETGIGPAEIGYLEWYGSGFAPEDEAEIGGLNATYQSASGELTCAIGSVKANIGHTFAASGIASLIKTAHALYHRYLPATPNWTGPKMATAWQNSPFYVPPQSQPWLLENGQNQRRAAINGLGADGAYAHLILSDDPTQGERPNPYLAQVPFYLVPISAQNQADLLTQLENLAQNLTSDTPLPTLVRQSFEAHRQMVNAPYTLSLVGGSKADLQREISIALKTVGDAFANGTDWKTPAGSYFSPQPLGRTGKVAFVYPGAFSSYPGLGRDLFQLFPELHQSFVQHIPNPAELVGQKWLYPRSLSALSEQDYLQHALKLMNNSIAMLQSGATYSTLVTQVLRQRFGLQAHSALGYSLGETTMMFALGVWAVADNNSAGLQDSPLFRERLSGSQMAVREFWGESADKRNLWAIFVLKAPLESIKNAVAGANRVYITHINTPTEAVIGGDPAQCAQVIKALQCEHIPVPYSHVIHCEPMRSEYDSFRQLNTLPVSDSPAIDFYFAAQKAPGPLKSEAIAHNIATAACQQVDFPGLIQQTYNDGARIFVELGPRSACTWWIKDILKNQPHLAVGINRRSADDRTGFIKLLAQLSSHGVKLELQSLYEAPIEDTAQQTRSLVRTVSLGGRRIQDVILSDENRKLFNEFTVEAVSPPNVETATIIPQRIPEPAFAVAEALKQPQTDNQKSLISQLNETLMTDTAKQPTPASIENGPNIPNIDFVERQLTELQANVSRTTQAHTTFLRGRRQGLAHLRDLIALQQAGQSNGEDFPPLEPPNDQPKDPRAISKEAQNRPNNYTIPAEVIWDEADLVTFAGGDIAPVFGEAYAIIDTYPRRVRLPLYPYLLVSRITKLQGQRGVYEASKMTTEYDIPFEAWYSTDGQIPWAVAVESGQCDLMLISYLGIDFQNKGERVYRLLDCTLTFLEEVPLEGHTLRYDISIDSFAKSGESLLFFFSYNCYVGDTMVLKMRGGCAGFFTDEELAGGKGIITTERELAEKSRIQKQYFEPLLNCSQTSFSRAELVQLCEGNISACFGPTYDQNDLNPSLRLPPETILMVDRITEVDPTGGAWGLGLISSEKDLEPDHWYFPCHFKDDQVMAGSLVAEGCSQLLQFYLLYMGFQTETVDARFQPIFDLPQVVRTRKQITACSSKLIYRMEITDIGLSPHPYAKANVDIIFEGRIVVDFKNLGLQLVEKRPDDPYYNEALTVRPHPNPSPKGRGANASLPPSGGDLRGGNKPALFNEYHIQEFAMGSISAAFGPDYQVFEGRRIPRTPNGDLKLFNRIVEINAERLVFTGNPNLVSEYDVPLEPWYYQQNSYPTMPYSVLMEIALQPCGFLSAYLGSTLPYAEQDFYFRNLDGDGHFFRDIEVRGKTITNRVELLSSTAIQGIIIQKFSFEMSFEGEPYYKGTAVFGYFKPEALINQVGLDQGKNIRPWYEQENRANLPASVINLSDEGQLYHAQPQKPHYRLAGQQLNFLDKAIVVPNGGRNGLGYVYAERTVNPQDWFFSCHFYQDPVMPGSLGVEAIIQAMQIYALQQDLGASLNSPRFAPVENHKAVWQYRGQIIPDNRQMYLEVHISKVDVQPGAVTITGNASLWKDSMRIYAVQDIAIKLVEG